MHEIECEPISAEMNSGYPISLLMIVNLSEAKCFHYYNDEIKSWHRNLKTHLFRIFF